MRNPQVPLRTAAAFRAAGYRVEAWVMAVDPLSSKLGILARYHEQREALGYGRFTVDAAHDAGAAGLLASVDALQDARAVDRILVATRGPNVIADRPGTARTPRVRDVITAERTRPWSPQEVQGYVERADRLNAILPIEHEHRPVISHLVAAARDRGEHYEAHQAVQTDVEPAVEATAEIGPAVEVEPAIEVQTDGQDREPVEVDSAPEIAAELEPDVGQNVERAGDEPDRAELDVEHRVELDDVEVEQQLDEPTSVPERVAAAEPTEHERAPEVGLPQVEQSQVEQSQVQQLALLDAEREVADEVGAEPLHAPELDPAAEPVRADAAAAARERLEQTRAAMAEARRQAEAADAQRHSRETATVTAAAVEQARREDAERQEQLSRWHEQDRDAELEQGIDDGPSLGRD